MKTRTIEDLKKDGFKEMMLDFTEESTRYLINDKGDIYDTFYGRFIMKQYNGGCRKYGKYLGINVWLENGRRTILYVHRLVGFTFLPKEEGKTEINHKDLNKCNNDVNNLEWCDRSGNLKHYYSSDNYKKKKAERERVKESWLNA